MNSEISVSESEYVSLSRSLSDVREAFLSCAGGVNATDIMSVPNTGEAQAWVQYFERVMKEAKAQCAQTIEEYERGIEASLGGFVSVDREVRDGLERLRLGHF